MQAFRALLLLSALVVIESTASFQESLAAASNIENLLNRKRPLVLPRKIEFSEQALQSLKSRQSRRAGNDGDGDGTYISQSCIAAARQYDQAATVKLCQEIFGISTAAPVYPNCPPSLQPPNPYQHPPPSPLLLPDGSCCNRGQDCASTYCDTSNRVCTRTCDVGGDPSQCPASMTGNSSLSSCTNCACPQNNLCNTQQFCTLCPQYVGPANLTVLQAASCDTTTVATFSQDLDPSIVEEACTQPPACLRSFAEAAGVLAQRNCFMFLTFQGINATCPNALQQEWNSLILQNLTWCQQNANQQLCGFLFGTIQSLIYYSNGQATTCSGLQSAGCCVGNVLAAFQEVGDTVGATLLSEWIKICGVNSASCPLYTGTSSGLRLGAVIGIAVACAVAAIILFIAAVWCYRRRSDALRWRRFGEEEMQSSPQQHQIQDPESRVDNAATAPPFDPSTFALFVGGDDEENGGKDGNSSNGGGGSASAAANLEDDDYPKKPPKQL